MRHDDIVVDAVDGVHLAVRRWRPDSTGSRGALVVIPGLKDHAGRYHNFARRLVKGGWCVYAADRRGYGLSGGGRAYTRFDDYLDDLEVLIQGVEREERGTPIYLMGHSVGGTIAALFATRKKARALRGTILSAAALRRDDGALAYAGQTKLLAAISSRSTTYPLDGEHFSRDPSTLKEYASDTLIQGAAPVRAAMELLAAVERVRDRAQDIVMPLLVLHGSEDRVTPQGGSRDFVEMVSSEDKTLSIYPGLFHDLLHEPERQQVCGDIHAWLDARVRAV